MTKKKLFSGAGKKRLLLDKESKYFAGVKKDRGSQESSGSTLKGGWRKMLKISK